MVADLCRRPRACDCDLFSHGAIVADPLTWNPVGMDARAAERFTEEEHAFLPFARPARADQADRRLAVHARADLRGRALDRRPHIAFFAGLATAIGAAVSMGFSEALSDTGQYTGRGDPWQRGLITGLGTLVGGVFHTRASCSTATTPRSSRRSSTVTIELIVLAIIRAKFFRTGFLRSFATVTLGGAIIVAVSAALGSAAWRLVERQVHVPAGHARRARGRRRRSRPRPRCPSSAAAACVDGLHDQVLGIGAKMRSGVIRKFSHWPLLRRAARGPTSWPVYVRVRDLRHLDVDLPVGVIDDPVEVGPAVGVDEVVCEPGQLRRQ